MLRHNYIFRAKFFHGKVLYLLKMYPINTSARSVQINIIQLDLLVVITYSFMDTLKFFQIFMEFCAFLKFLSFFYCFCVFFLSFSSFLFLLSYSLLLSSISGSHSFCFLFFCLLLKTGYGCRDCGATDVSSAFAKKSDQTINLNYLGSIYRRFSCRCRVSLS